MGKTFLYVPFDEAIVRRAKDGYVNGMIAAFKAAGHPDEHVLYPAVQQCWERRKPDGDESRFVTSMKGSAEVDAIWHQMSRGSRPGMTKYLVQSRPRGTKALAEVGSSDMLFVVGHSSYQGGWLVLKEEREESGTKVIDKYWIRVDLLAALLSLEGLSKTHRYVKLNSCYGGGSDELDRALAKDFAKELKGRGHHHVKVGGYQYLMTAGAGDVGLSAPVETRLDTGDATVKNQTDSPLATVTETFLAKNNPSLEELMYEKDPYRVWYDGSGTCVRWNAPDGYFASSSEDGMFGGVTTQKLMPLLAEDDPRYAAYQRKKAAEGEWIAAMNDVVTRGRR